MIGTVITEGMITVAEAVSYTITKKLVVVAMDCNKTEVVEFSRRTISEIPEMSAFLYYRMERQSSDSGDYIRFGLTERFDCLDWIK